MRKKGGQLVDSDGMNPEGTCKVLVGNHSSLVVTNASGRRQVMVTPISATNHVLCLSSQANPLKWQGHFKSDKKDS